MECYYCSSNAEKEFLYGNKWIPLCKVHNPKRPQKCRPICVDKFYSHIKVEKDERFHVETPTHIAPLIEAEQNRVLSEYQRAILHKVRDAKVQSLVISKSPFHGDQMFTENDFLALMDVCLESKLYIVPVIEPKTPKEVFDEFTEKFIGKPWKGKNNED